MPENTLATPSAFEFKTRYPDDSEWTDWGPCSNEEVRTWLSAFGGPKVKLKLKTPFVHAKYRLVRK